MAIYLELSPNVDEATGKAQDLAIMLAKGRFILAKIDSIVRGVVSTLHRMEKPTNGNVRALVAAEESVHVSGLRWNYQFGNLVVSSGNSPDPNCTLTQKNLPSLVSAAYDPIGPFALYTVKARLLLNDIWRFSGQQMDETLPITWSTIPWMERRVNDINWRNDLQEFFDGQAA